MITVGIPNTGTIKAQTMTSLVPALFEAAGYYRYKYGEGIQYTMVCPVGCYVHLNRNICAEEAIKMGAHHLFFVDADMQFPADALVKLLAVDKDIVGGTYNKRGLPLRPILDQRQEELPKYPCKINALPTGLILIKMEVFHMMERPWFAHEFTPGKLEWVGEDVYFCRKANKYGFELWLEPTINIKHIGDYEY